MPYFRIDSRRRSGMAQRTPESIAMPQTVTATGGSETCTASLGWIGSPCSIMLATTILSTPSGSITTLL
jgi:hypothetical protein